MTTPDFSDEEERALWEQILMTPAEVEFREFVLERVAPSAGESVLSVGCGPGFETAAIAHRVGEGGTVTGIDVNEAVLAAAEDRCGDLPQVSFEQGSGTDLPAPAGSYELAIAKQVLSAISDVESVLEELFRVVTSGGRAAVTAGAPRSHVTHSPTDRMERADEIYRDEMAGRQLGTRLMALLPDAGFEVEDVIPRAKYLVGLTPQVERGIVVQRGLLASSDSFETSEIDEWERDVRELAADGGFLSASITFLYLAGKPG